MIEFERLAEALNAAGVPVAYIEGNVGAAVVTYAPSATQAQRDQGETIVASFDWAAPAKAVQTAAGNEATIRQQAEAALADLRAYRDRTTTTTAQDKAAIKLLCRVAIILIRLALRRLEATG